jgi:hypothetical protein
MVTELRITESSRVYLEQGKDIIIEKLDVDLGDHGEILDLKNAIREVIYYGDAFWWDTAWKEASLLVLDNAILVLRRRSSNRAMKSGSIVGVSTAASRYN